MVKVSIIVPVYNAGNKLKKCIKSILNQSFREFELILVNDGSTDNSLNICNEYAKKDKRIKVINKHNEGSIATRRRGVVESKGEFIMFVDADDWVHKDIVSRLYNETIDNSCDITVCNAYKVIGDRAIIKQTNNSKYFDRERIYEGTDIKDELAEAWLHGHPFPAGLVCKLYSRELLIESGKYLDKIYFLGDDLFYNLEMFLKANKIKVITDSLYYYRTGGFTSKYMPYHFDDIVNGYEIQKEVIDEFYLDTKQKRYNGISIMLLNSFKTTLLNLIYSKMTEEEIKSYIDNYASNRNIIESIKNRGAIKYFEKEYLMAIQNRDTDYLYNMGKEMFNKSKYRRKIIKLISKLNIL